MVGTQLAKFTLFSGEKFVRPVLAQTLERAPDPRNLADINPDPKDHSIYQRARNDKPITRKSMAHTTQVADAPSDFSPNKSRDMGPSSARARLTRSSAEIPATGIPMAAGPC